MALQVKITKGMPNEGKEIKEPVEPSTPTSNSNINAPKYGTVIPNRIFVGGISSSTTEDDLVQLFSNYGTVINSKIIVDRAGVSKGYGFVTFETDDEAKRLQKEAENIVLKERRLNIAPAIRKQQQAYGRTTYEGAQPGPGSPVPLPNQVYRQNGVTYTFHNGMAYFPHQPVPPQAMTPLPANHVEHSPVYTTTGTYSGLPQTNSGQAFPFSYAPQGHIYYQATHYPYHVPQFEGCYQLGEGHNGMMVQSGTDSSGMIFPQYYLTHQPSQPELTYFQPQGTIQPLSISQESVQPVLLTPPRGYDSTAVFYSEQKTVINEHSTPPLPPLPSLPALPPPPPPLPLPLPPVSRNSEGIKADVNNKLETPVVSLLKLHNEKYGGRQYQTTKKSNQFIGKKIAPRHLNNNNPDVTNRNVGKKGRHSPIVPAPVPRPYIIHNRNHSSSPVQVPQFPYFSGQRQFFNPAPALTSFYSAPPRRTYYHRNKYGGRGKNNTKWFNKDNAESGTEEGSCVMPNTLTPPITPRCPQDVDISVSQAEDIVQSMQALAI